MENIYFSGFNKDFYFYFVTFFGYIVVNSLDLKLFARRPFNCEVCFCFWSSIIGALCLWKIEFLFLNFAFSLLLINIMNKNYDI